MSGHRLGELGEVELEVRARGNVDALEDAFGFVSTGDLEVEGVVAGDCLPELGLLTDPRADLLRDLPEVGEAIHTTLKVGPDRLDLSDAKEERPRMLNAISFAEKVRMPYISTW